jgi:hypothetical protein
MALRSCRAIIGVCGLLACCLFPAYAKRLDPACFDQGSDKAAVLVLSQPMLRLANPEQNQWGAFERTAKQALKALFHVPTAVRQTATHLALGAVRFQL